MQSRGEGKGGRTTDDMHFLFLYLLAKYDDGKPVLEINQYAICIYFEISYQSVNKYLI